MSLGGLRERLEMRPHGGDLRQRVQDRLLHLLGDIVRLVERERPRQLEVQRDFGAAPDLDHVHVVDLAHASDLQRGRLHPLAQRRLRRGLRLDVDDDVRLWERAAHGVLDVVRCGVPLSDGRAGRHADHDVDEMEPGRLPEAQAAEADAGHVPLDRAPGRGGRLGGRPVHEHVHVAAHQPCSGAEHDQRHEERRDRVGVRMAGARDDEADQDGGRAGEVAREVERVRLQGRAREPPRRPPGDGCARDVDGDHDADDRKRVPGRVNVRRGRPRDPRRRLPDDQHGCADEDGGLGERRQVLGLSVAVVVPAVGRANRVPDGVEREQRGDEVGSRVQRLGDQPE